MALIICPECGKERVSDTAILCPECGCSYMGNKVRRAMANIVNYYFSK